MASPAVYLVSARRTPIGRYGGGLRTVSAVDLAITAGRAALADAGADAESVEHCVLGMARQAGNGPNPGRQVAIGLGAPQSAPAYTVNEACASGMLSIAQARDMIRLGEADLVLAGGTESMSRVPYLMDAETARWGTKMGHVPLVDAMYRDGFHCPLADQLMGRTAETLAQQHGIGRQEQDEYAERSQRLAALALEAGRFADELAPVVVAGRRGETTVDTDEHPRPDSTVEAMKKLKPVFVPESEGGTVHAGNSSGITDGAAMSVVASERALERLGVEPLARIRDTVVVGVDPAVMGIGPVPATRRILERNDMALDDIDLIEINEAFAAQVLACTRELDVPLDRLNVNGGAIALGHPIGCTGARITTTLAHEMKRRGAGRGLATLCVSGGLGYAMLLEAP